MEFCGGIRLLWAWHPARSAGQPFISMSRNSECGYRTEGQERGFWAGPAHLHRTPKPEIWLADSKDRDGNQLALMSEVPSANS